MDPQKNSDVRALAQLMQSADVPLSEAQIIALEDYVRQVGGIEQARRALESLEQLGDAA